MTQSASAANWHDYVLNPPCSLGTYHGMKQGDLYDGIYNAEIEGGRCGYHKICTVGHYYTSGGHDRSETFGVDRICAATTGFDPDTYGWARVFADTPNGAEVISTHYHCAHQRGGC